MPDALRVLEAGFSPVKGTRHLPRPSVRLEEYGAVGDRVLCLVDVPTRRVLRTVQHPGLVAVVARLEDGVLGVALPDGRTVAAAAVPTGERLVAEYWGRDASLELLDGPHAELFSAHLGRPVRLAAAPPRAVVFGAGVTIVAASSLADLAERAGVPVEPGRFRATLVVDTDAAPYAEEGWLGREVAVGSAVVRIGGPIPRCAVIDVDPITGQRGSGLLRTLAAYRPRTSAGEPCFGVYAEVVAPGTVQGTP